MQAAAHHLLVRDLRKWDVTALTTFVIVRDGLIVNYREYWDPMASTKAMSGASFNS